MQLAATARTNPNKAAWMQYCLRCRKERPESDFSREMTGSTSIVGVLCVPSIQELKMVETRKKQYWRFPKRGYLKSPLDDSGHAPGIPLVSRLALLRLTRAPDPRNRWLPHHRFVAGRKHGRDQAYVSSDIARSKKHIQ